MIHSSVVSAAFGTPYFTANGIRNSRDQNTTACGLVRLPPLCFHKRKNRDAEQESCKWNTKP